MTRTRATEKRRHGARAGGALASGLATIAIVLSAGQAAQASFPGENGLIAYPAADGIHVMRDDGTGDRLVATVANARDPAWSRDGRRIAFAADGEVFVLDLKNGRVRRVTSTAAIEREPSWSPDDKRIAFIRGDREIWIAKTSNRKSQRLLVADDFTRSVDWSPDGSKIAFSAHDLYVVPLRHGGIVRLTDEPEQTSGPNGTVHPARDVGEIDWAPDGSRLSFDEPVNAPCDGCTSGIWTIRADGTQRTHLVDDRQSTAFRAPRWSPDGSVIAFSEFEFGGDRRLWMVPAGGGTPTAVAPAGADTDWQPLPRRGRKKASRQVRVAR